MLRIAILLVVALYCNGFVHGINANTPTGEPTLVARLTGHTDWVYSVAFSPDGSILASGSSDNTVRLWDTQTSNHLRTLEGHTDSVWYVMFSPDGIWLVSAGSDDTLRLWEVNAGEAIAALEHTVWAGIVALSPDGLMLTRGGFGGVTLWDIYTGEAQVTLEFAGWVQSAAFSPDGLMLAIVDDDDFLTLWDADTGALKTTISLRGYALIDISVAFSPDGGVIAVGGTTAAISDFSGVLRLFDVDTGEEIANFADKDEWLLYANGINDLAFSPDGSTLASGNGDSTVILWDAQTGELLHKLEGHTRSVTSVAFSPDRSLLASGSWDNTVFLWDVSSVSAMNSTAVEPRAKRLATLGEIKLTTNTNK